MMSWLLTRYPVDQPRIQDVFQTLGRAAYVASQFDQDVKELVAWLELTGAVRDNFSTWTIDDMTSFRSSVARKVLHRRIRYAVHELNAEESDVAALARAKEARNALFHEMPALPLHDPSHLYLGLPPYIVEQQQWRQEAARESLLAAVDQVRSRIYELTPGCALVGAWLFQLVEQEKDEYFPQEFFDAYSAQLGSWILAPVWDLLPRLEGEPVTPTEDGAIHPTGRRPSREL